MRAVDEGEYGMPLVTTVGTTGEHVIVVEVDDAPAPDDAYHDVGTRGPRLDKLRAAGVDLLGEAIELVRTCAERVSGELDHLGEKAAPDEIELQLAVKLDYQFGAVLVAGGTAGAQLQVTLRWTPSRD